VGAAHAGRSTGAAVLATLAVLCAIAVPKTSTAAGLAVPVRPSASPGIGTAATATASAQSLGATQIVPLPAVAGIDGPALAGCDADLLQHLIASDPTVLQWIMVVVPSTSATTGTLAMATVVGNTWSCTIAETPAEVGRQGIRPLMMRRSGDDTTPSGIFPLGVVATPQGRMSFFGNSADPGAKGPYRRVQPGDCYGANPNTPGYGHWRVDRANCTGADELLSVNVQAYEHVILIGANTEPDVSGDTPGETPFAAAIFLHRTVLTPTGQPKPTSGCVSIGHEQLVAAVRAIDPLSNPRFAIGTRENLSTITPRGSLPHR
jgi:L,D-peptidoglycan transpeptidase YkuD (ErfK/YbiS/YcfS/YnhG family)